MEWRDRRRISEGRGQSEGAGEGDSQGGGEVGVGLGRHRGRQVHTRSKVMCDMIMKCSETHSNAKGLSGRT